MKNVFLALALMLLTSCAYTQNHDSAVPAVVARDSVYKVRVSITVDATAIGGGKEARANWSGTGWVAQRKQGRSYVMTAGHVCESRKTYTYTDIDYVDDKFVVTVHELPITKIKHTLIGRDDTEFDGAKVLRDEDLDDNFGGNDLCLLSLPGNLGVPLPVATDDPPYGSLSEVIGAPHGLWGGGVAVTANLKFSGRGAIFRNGTDALAFTGEAGPGNSGSAIMYHGKVVALLNLGATRFNNLSTGIPHEEIRKFILKALHEAPAGD